MKTKLVSIGKSLVEIRSGEGRVAWLMFVYLFLVIATFAVVKPVRSSLFLQKFGARNLPYIYLATAVLAGLVAWIHSRLLDRFNIVAVQVLTHLFFISNLVLFWFAFREETAWLSAAFFLWVNIFTVTANTLFWMFANHYYNPREAKRLYGFINAGGTVGAVASGLAVSAVVRDVGTENMLLVCSGVLGVCILLTYLISRLGKDRFALEEASYADERPDPRKVSQKLESSPLRTLFASSYAKYIALALGLSLVISTLIDYQFNVVVEETYLDKDAKTAFFSSFMAGVNALSFVLQFFLTSPLLRRLGIGFSLLVLPLTLFGGASWMALYPGLTAVMFLKVGDGSVRYSIEQSTRDVLYLPIPNRVMGKLKTFVDVFVQRLAKGVGSLLILALITWWALGNQVLSYVSILLAFLWVTCAVLLRQEYRQQLRRFLSREDLHEEHKFVRLLDETTRAELLAALESGDEETVLYSLELLEGSRDPSLVSALKRIVTQGSPRLQAQALHLLAQAGDTSVIQEAERLLTLESVEVQEAAINYLCGGSPCGAKERMEGFLMADDLRVRTAAMTCMANCGGIEGERMAQSLFEGMLLEQGENGLAARRLLAKTLGHIRPPSPLHSYLRPLLQDPSEGIAQEALQTARKILRRDSVPLIIEKLADPRLSTEALETLKAYGEKVLGTLRDYIDDESVLVTARRRLPAVFVEVGTEKAARDLVACLPQSDLQLRYEVVKALNKMKNRLPSLDIDKSPLQQLLTEEMQNAYSLLSALYVRTSTVPQHGGSEDHMAAIDLLSQDYRRGIERIFRLLGLLFSQPDIYTAYGGLNSPRPELKASAVELLDNLLPAHLKKILLPLVDDEISIQEKLKMGESLWPTAIRVA